MREKPTSAAAFPGVKEHTLVVHSLSKTYAMTGWRVGYLAAPARVIENALKAGQNSITCVAPFVQKAAAFALTDPGIQQSAAEMRDGLCPSSSAGIWILQQRQVKTRFVSPRPWAHSISFWICVR